MALPTGDQISAFVARAGRIHGRRRVLRALLDLALALSIGLAIATAVTALTLRGDLVGWVCVACAAMAGGFTFAAWRRARVRAAAIPRPLRTARTIARTQGPLGRHALSRDDGALRLEVLGAVELSAENRQGGERAPGSAELADAYRRRIADRLIEAQAQRAVPALLWRPRLMAAIAMSAVWLALLTTPGTAQAFAQLTSFEDARPPKPAEAIWTRLELTLSYPQHTGRPPRKVPNPSGALRVPAGTRVQVDFWTKRNDALARLALQPQDTSRPPTSADMQRVVEDEGAKEMSAAPSPANAGDAEVPNPARRVPLRHWRGEVQVNEAGTWVGQLFEAGASSEEEPAAYSNPQRFEIEADAAPEVELAALSEKAKEASEFDTVQLRFSARDDFGLSRAELVYQLSDGSVHRLPIKDPAGPLRRWSQRYAWDLNQVPVDERGQLSYWIEVWDNDPQLQRPDGQSLASGVDTKISADGLRPGLGGKVGRSARQQLLVRDREREHALNIESMRELRDAAVDMLAARLTAADLFDPPTKVLARQRAALEAVESPGGDPGQPAPSPLAVKVQGQIQIQQTRALHEASGALLARLSQNVDALSIDPLARERDVRALAAIHARLFERFTQEQELHASLPPGAETRAEPAELRRLLAKLETHNQGEQSQLEDEIIRLDDLVDGELIRQLEAMSARLEASQQKLVELLELLKAGDESVKAQIQQLQERIREDMRRFQQTRQKLSKEVGREFFNRDAFSNMEKMMQSQDLLEALKRGDVDAALQQAREALDEMRGVNDAMQERLSQGGEEARLDPEQEARMKLLRELSRLQDQQRGLRGAARELEKSWRAAVADARAKSSAEKLRTRAQALLDGFDQVNDARLSRQGREDFEDAREALQSLVEQTRPQPPGGAAAEGERGEAKAGPLRALEPWDAAARAKEALEAAQAGTPDDDNAAKQIAQMSKAAQELETELRRALPKPSEALDETQQGQARTRAGEQGSLRAQADALDEDALSDPLPEHGRRALRDASQAMRQASSALQQANGRDAGRAAQVAQQGLQRAIDSLRESSPPPPAGGGGDSSTEAERDKTLRDAVVEAMREGRGEQGADKDSAVSRYYEELLE